MHFAVTKQLRDIINDSSMNTQLKEKLCTAEFISRKDLINIYQQERPTATLLDLIKLTKLHIPTIKEPEKPKTKEFLESMRILRLKAKEQEYQNLITPAPAFTTLYEPDPESKMTIGQAHKELKTQMTTIVNILISVASVLYAVWYWTDSSMNIKVSHRVLISLFFGILVLVAEVVVYLGYLNKVEEARTKERSKKEIKKVIKSM